MGQRGSTASVRSFVYEGIVCLREGIVATRNDLPVRATRAEAHVKKKHKAHEVLRAAGAFNADWIGTTARAVIARRPVGGGASGTLTSLGDA